MGKVLNMNIIAINKIKSNLKVWRFKNPHYAIERSKEMYNKALQWTPIPLRSIGATELSRYMYSGPQNETIC